MSPLRIFVADAQTMFRESVIAVLGLQKGFQVVGQSGTVAEAKSLVPKSKPDILLLDMKLPGQSGPGQNGIELLGEMPTLCPRCKTIVMAGQEVEDEVVEVMRLGSRGFLLKQSSIELFVKCIQKVSLGEIWLDGKMTEAVLGALSGKRHENQAGGKETLSPRELEVIQLVIQGYKNRDIAQKLFISEKTVKNHLSAIFNKLGVSDRLEMTLYVFEKRFFPLTVE